jgi:predicted benzoate:H+ symporter BenE
LRRRTSLVLGTVNKNEERKKTTNNTLCLSVTLSLSNTLFLSLLLSLSLILSFFLSQSLSLSYTLSLLLSLSVSYSLSIILFRSSHSTSPIHTHTHTQTHTQTPRTITLPAMIPVNPSRFSPGYSFNASLFQPQYGSSPCILFQQESIGRHQYKKMHENLLED